jgi:hypothetical protein
MGHMRGAPDWKREARATSDFRTWQAWVGVHQPFELDWWRNAIPNGGHLVDDAGFAARWQPIRKFIAPRGRVLDIGCGPRPPFFGSVVIDPLAMRYQEIAPAAWWQAVCGIHAVPAETMIEQLRGQFDTVVCWNCLDHTIGWRDILDNMWAYGAPGARLAIATDFHPPFIGHPGYERETFMAEIDKRFAVIERCEPFDQQQPIALALLLQARLGYKGGGRAQEDHNQWAQQCFAQREQK